MGVVMAQAQSQRLIEAFSELSPQDRDILATECARTGCMGQSYTRDFLGDGMGPAFLVYYGPALMQRNVANDARGALCILAEVLRQARHLWPLQRSSWGETVTLRIDAIKDSSPHSLQRVPPGECWALQR